MQLSEIIIERIKNEGPLSFHDFMEMALYYPGLGYYTSAPGKIGAKGDFYTSCNLSALYGEMIGRQLEEMWRHMGKGNFTVVEYGAGTGLLCHDILGYLRNNAELYECLDYCIIEKSPVMRQKEKELLHEKVSWYSSLAELPPITGCILSNELLDNFAAHQVVMQEQLMEVFVGYDNDFTEVLLPANNVLRDYFTSLGVTLPPGYRTEVNMEAVEWITHIAQRLEKGYVLTVDYGYPSYELYKDYRREGTLVCYNRHQAAYDPYKNIGSQDITTHINFSSLCHWGAQSGLEYCGYTNQAHFLLGLGLRERLAEHLLSGTDDLYARYRKNAFIMHRLLNDMGSKFKVLVQQKGLPRLPLSGLRLVNSTSIDMPEAPCALSAA